MAKENVDFERTSQLSGITRKMTFFVDKKDVRDYNAGKHVQYAFPYLDSHKREFIKSGITKEEWDDTFKNF